MKTRLLIDSRAREGGNAQEFWLELRPTIENVRKVSLVWADIPQPLQTPGGPYFLVRIPELGTHTQVLGSSFSNGTATTAGRRRFLGAVNIVSGLINTATDAIIRDLPRESTLPDAGVFYANSSGIETTFVIPITVNVDERCFYSPETSFRQEMEYSPPTSIQKLTVNISRNFGATQVTGESVFILELEHD